MTTTERNKSYSRTDNIATIVMLITGGAILGWDALGIWSLLCAFRLQGNFNPYRNDNT